MLPDGGTMTDFMDPDDERPKPPTPRQSVVLVRKALRDEPQMWLQRGTRNRWFCPHCGEIVNSIVLPPGEQLALLPDLPLQIVEHLEVCIAVKSGIPAQKRVSGGDASLSGLHQAMHDARMRQRHTLRLPPNLLKFQIGSLFRPMEAVSGDFYEFLTLPDGRLGIGIGDASGHGVEACMLTAVTKKVLAIYGRGGLSPRESLCAVNREIHEDVMQGVFISAAYGILNPENRQLTYVRAGHPPAIIYNPRRTPNVIQLNANGLALGVDKGPRFEQVIQEQTVQLEAGDLLVFYTDGLIELPAPPPDPGEIGIEGFIFLLKKYYERPVDDLVTQIWHRAERLFRTTGQPDDITMVAIKVS